MLIAALGFAVYANSLGGKFIWDDQYLITENRSIKNHSVAGLFTSNLFQDTDKGANFYRPAQALTYMADYSFWKLRPFGYHLTNILLHILTAFAVFWFISVIFKDRLLSMLTAALFVVHPVHTEAVSYISGRADPLAALFILLAFGFYIREAEVIHSSRAPLRVPYLLTPLFYIAALLSRESSLIFPILLLLYHFTFRKKIPVKNFIAVLVVSTLYILLRALMLKSTTAHVLAIPSLAHRIPGFFAAITNYTRILFLPFNLHMEYGAIVFKFSDPRVVLGIAILAFSTICAIFNRNKNRLAFFGIFWMILTILPQSNLYPINAYMAEHWLYLPSVGFFLVVAGASNLVISNQVSKVKLTNLTWLDITRLAITASGILALIAFWSILTIRQNTYWREPISFYERTLKYSPNSPRVLNNLGNEYYASGNLEKALVLYKKTIGVDPKHVEAYGNIGNIYNDLRQYDDAIVYCKKAIEADPAYAKGYNNLGNAYNNTGRKKEAIAEYEKTISLAPYYADGYYNMAIAYSDIGQRDKAIELYKKALSLDPFNVDAYNNLNNLLRERK